MNGRGMKAVGSSPKRPRRGPYHTCAAKSMAQTGENSRHHRGGGVCAKPIANFAPSLTAARRWFVRSISLPRTMSARGSGRGWGGSARKPPALQKGGDLWSCSERCGRPCSALGAAAAVCRVETRQGFFCRTCDFKQSWQNQDWTARKIHDGMFLRRVRKVFPYPVPPTNLRTLPGYFVERATVAEKGLGSKVFGKVQGSAPWGHNWQPAITRRPCSALASWQSPWAPCPAGVRRVSPRFLCIPVPISLPSFPSPSLGLRRHLLRSCPRRDSVPFPGHDLVSHMCPSQTVPAGKIRGRKRCPIDLGL